jgi:hypothetical protein
MYISYSLDVINTEFYNLVLAGKIAAKDADTLKIRMAAKRKSHLTGIIICAVIFAISVTLGINYDTFKFSDNFMIGLLVVLFTSFIFIAFQINGFMIAQKYLSALEKNYSNTAETTVISDKDDSQNERANGQEITTTEQGLVC